MRRTKETGITLIALVITIIVLLILAGVAINLTVGDNGIFKRAEESVSIYQNAANNEATELNNIYGTLDELVEIAKGIPEILDIEYTTTTNSATVTVIAQRAKKYIYSYKKITEETYIIAAEQEGNIYTFEGLEAEVTYNIKVEAVNEAGKVEKEIEITIGEMPSAEGLIEFKNLVWENGKASISMSTTTNYTIQYQVNSTTGEWRTGTTASNLSHNETVYARLWDGVNGGDSANKLIKDTEAPNMATIVPSTQSTNTASTITATVTQSDSQSGLKIGACKWVYNTTSTAIGTNAGSYTGGTFSSASQNLSLKVTTPGTYYLHVLTTDNAGLVRETISKPVTVSAPAEVEYSVTPCPGVTGGGVKTIYVKKGGSVMLSCGHMISGYKVNGKSHTFHPYAGGTDQFSLPDSFKLTVSENATVEVIGYYTGCNWFVNIVVVD